uniref:Uncharacterized protein n=1 Tax=Medicago truncatula TaxID=3880 RepID=A2Q4V5_MEDTR|nr:hypothetical protein MtrDRAFT_AC157891g28v2 [Medicago truncatula]
MGINFVLFLDNDIVNKHILDYILVNLAFAQSSTVTTAIRIKKGKSADEAKAATLQKKDPGAPS